MEGLRVHSDGRYLDGTFGRGGHAAKPHECIDPLLAAAQLIVALQSVVARTLDPLASGVISVCVCEVRPPVAAGFFDFFALGMVHSAHGGRVRRTRGRPGAPPA